MPQALTAKVYTMPGCPNCVTAKNLLKSKGIMFEEVSLTTEEERKGFYEICGPAVRQMPQIFLNGQRVGGLAGLQAALKQPTVTQY